MSRACPAVSLFQAVFTACSVSRSTRGVRAFSQAFLVVKASVRKCGPDDGGCQCAGCVGVARMSDKHNRRPVQGMASLFMQASA